MTERLQPDVVLLADGPTGLAALRSLVAQCRVVQVFRKPDQPEAGALRAFAKAQGISVAELRELNQLRKVIADLRPAAVVISSFDRIIPPQILALCRFVNVHYSLLPHYRGRANVNWAIINGETTAGISIHLVIPELDGGNLLFQQAIPIGSSDTVTCLYNRLNAIQERELGGVVLRVVTGHQGTGQNTDQASYGCTRVPDDGEIDWRQPTDAIDRLIRGLTPPFPGAFTHLDAQRLVIASASPRLDAPLYIGRVPGRIVGRSPSEGWVDVLTGDGVLRLSSVLTANSERPCAAASVIGSTRATLGLSRLDLLRRIVALEDRLASLEQRQCAQE
ncbi:MULTISPECIES: formyltransferase family protein [unclassified Bradyrhizobium]|uniref:methionyl-tRNA formyltransferase n=1 Tax=unclassified Bradyrhizobium TaxID=2631580 RepID=UPI001FF8CC34|nr:MULTISPECIES: formyltransferase family protein [unclassified Bradyrhizobium]MCK1709654.1 methionyl-tRNA formyltransferase [Bradyrhizobium sp. 143]MCK1731579.1 methionyl-tRNA formyltransferase [Bradyrhizobium sp. 142]